MKQIYTIRWADGQLMKFDGATWGVVSGAVLSNYYSGTDAESKRSRNAGLLVFRGKLYARYRTDFTTNKIRLAEFTGSGFSVVAEIAADSGIQEYWGNVFESSGKMYWLVAQGYRGNDRRPYFAIYTVSQTGATPTLSRRETSEMGATTSNGIDVLSHEQWGHNTAAPKVIAYRDRMLMVPPGSVAAYNNYTFMWDYTEALTVDNSGNVSVTPVLDADEATRWSPQGQQDQNQLYVSRYLNYYITACPWKDKVYGVSMSGILYAYDTSSRQRTEIADLSLMQFHQIRGNQTFVTDASIRRNGWLTSLTFVDGGTNANAGNFPWRANALGNATVMILNYNGTANNPKRAWINHGNNEHNGAYDIRLIDETGVYLPLQPVGTQFNVYHNPDTQNVPGNENYSERFVHSFVWGNKLYIFFANGRRQQVETNRPVNEYPNWGLVVYDGTNPPTSYTYTNGTSPWQNQSVSVELDETAGILNVFYFDISSQNVKHEQFNLSTGVRTSQGTAYSRLIADNKDRWIGMPIDAFVSFDGGDVTAAVGNATVDIAERTATIPYTLYGINSDTATVEIQFNTGNGLSTDWTNCTRKGTSGEGLTGLASSPAGTSHTFVHDLAADLGPTYLGTVRHRIRIATQTRN